MLARCLLTCCLALPLAALAAGSGSLTGPAASSPQWKEGRALVEAGRFEAAIPKLLEVVGADDTHADAYNLLGFAHRKTGKLDAALEYYRKALALDPDHRGAHEYIGETYLEMGDLATAKRHLEHLDESCTFGCSEYDDLKAAIERYEAR